MTDAKADETISAVALKLVLLGDSGVGKSCIVSRFVTNKFGSKNSMKPTVGAAFLNKTVKDSANNRTIRFQIWDTAGQERFRSLAPMYYRNTSAAVVVFDVESIKSFEGAKRWIAELRSNDTSNVLVALAGNKTDLPIRNVTAEMAREYAEREGVSFFETSALTGEGIIELFMGVAARMPLGNSSPPSEDTHNLQKEILSLEDKLDRNKRGVGNKLFSHEVVVAQSRLDELYHQRRSLSNARGEPKLKWESSKDEARGGRLLMVDTSIGDAPPRRCWEIGCIVM